MRRAVLMAVGALSACSTTLTPSQSVYGAWRAYGEALHVARVYAEGERPSPAIVAAVDDVHESKEVQTAERFAKAYFACRADSQAASQDPQIVCGNWDFSRPSTYVITLRNAASAILLATSKGEAP